MTKAKEGLFLVTFLLFFILVFLYSAKVEANTYELNKSYNTTKQSLK